MHTLRKCYSNRVWYFTALIFIILIILILALPWIGRYFNSSTLTSKCMIETRHIFEAVNIFNQKYQFELAPLSTLPLRASFLSGESTDESMWNFDNGSASCTFSMQGHLIEFINLTNSFSTKNMPSEALFQWPQEKVIEKGKEFMELFNPKIAKELVFDSVYSYPAPKNPQDIYWQLHWTRKSQNGIPYLDDSIDLIISQNEGIRGIKSNLNSPSQEFSEPKLSKKEAEIESDLAKNNLLHRSFIAKLLRFEDYSIERSEESPVLKIANVNQFFSSDPLSQKRDVRPSLGPSKLCWVISYSLKLKSGQPTQTNKSGHLNIYVDAISGNVVGGQQDVIVLPLSQQESKIKTSFTSRASQIDEKQQEFHLYDEKADGFKQITDALVIAKKGNKRVMLQFGFNRCGWCIKLHNLFSTDEVIAKQLEKAFILVLIDMYDGHNNEVDRKYGNPSRFGWPSIVILDKDGEKLTTKNTTELEEGKNYNPIKVLAFLKEWSGQNSKKFQED